MATTTKECPSCGADLSASQVGQPCSACLMQLGLQTWANQSQIDGFGMLPTVDPSGVEQGFQDSIEELELLFPQLEILHVVGQGGMGTVYCARQKSLNRLVALKVIKPDAKAKSGFADRFVREAQALAQLNHPNIITVYDFGQSGDTYFFIMEFVDGINLRQMLQGDRRLEPRHALQIVPAVCDALQYAHDKGIVHRDIKPENILIDTEGKVRIADFGLAKLLDKTSVSPTLTQAHQVMGTMHYMAPEQFERPMDVDHRADIYSLGVVIYELLTGELPLGRFAPPSKKVNLDVRLDEIVLQTLEKEPELRYQRVYDVKTDMQSVADHEQARPGYVSQPVSEPVPPVKSHKPASNPSMTGPRPRSGFWGILTDSQAYRNGLYNILSFPLSILYFVSVVVLFAVGVSTVIIWIGIPILLFLFGVVHAYMKLERGLARKLLRTEVPFRPLPSMRGKNLAEKARNLAFNRGSWMGILYFLGKFPLSIVGFALTIVLTFVPLSLVLAPVTSMIPGNDMNIGIVQLDSPTKALILVLPGVLMAFISLHIISGVTWLHAGWARLCLRRSR